MVRAKTAPQECENFKNGTKRSGKWLAIPGAFALTFEAFGELEFEKGDLKRVTLVEFGGLEGLYRLFRCCSPQYTISLIHTVPRNLHKWGDTCKGAFPHLHSLTNLWILTPHTCGLLLAMFCVYLSVLLFDYLLPVISFIPMYFSGLSVRKYVLPRFQS